MNYTESCDTEEGRTGRDESPHAPTPGQILLNSILPQKRVQGRMFMQIM